MTKAEQLRLVTWRLKILRQAEAAGSVARACRHFGISRKSFYKWKKRYAAHGDAGLCDRPRMPRRFPRATPPEVVSKILYLRQHYHFGPRKIADYLKRFHDVAVAGSSVHRILWRQQMNRLPANQKHRPHGRRWQRYEKPQPGHRLQLDVKFLEMPMELRLKFGAVVRLDHVDAKRQAPQDVVDEADRGALVARIEDLQHANPRAVIDGGALIESFVGAWDALARMDLNKVDGMDDHWASCIWPAICPQQRRMDSLRLTWPSLLIKFDEIRKRLRDRS